MAQIAKLGRVATHTKSAEALRSNQRAVLKEWRASEHPKWLTEDVYRNGIQPALRRVTVSAIASAAQRFIALRHMNTCGPLPPPSAALAEAGAASGCLARYVSSLLTHTILRRQLETIALH